MSLEQYGIHDAATWKAWMLKNHPDKGGDHDTIVTVHKLWLKSRDQADEANQADEADQDLATHVRDWLNQRQSMPPYEAYANYPIHQIPSRYRNQYKNTALLASRTINQCRWTEKVSGKVRICKKPQVKGGLCDKHQKPAPKPKPKPKPKDRPKSDRKLSDPSRLIASPTSLAVNARRPTRAR